MTTLTVIDPKAPPTGRSIIRRSWRVGRFACAATYDVSVLGPGVKGDIRYEWAPRVPGRGDLKKRHLAEHVRQRNMMLQDVANEIGGSIAVVEP